MTGLYGRSIIGAVGPIDVLIVTAVPEEYAAVIEAGGGEAAWSTETGPAGLTVAIREVEGKGGSLRIAVTQALGMGGTQAVIAAADLVREHDVQCLAMCGVCAGKRGDVALGDVIIADRVWQYGTGKRKVEVTGGKEVVTEQEDVEMYRLHPPAWKQAAERFAVDPGSAWLNERPRSYEAQGDWILERVLHGADPLSDAESRTKCADLDKALARLWKKELLADGTLDLTEAGKKHVQRLLLMNRNALPEAKPLRVHVGPIASGSQVMADGQVFDRLSDVVRKVLGVEMEAAAIGAFAWAKGLPYAIVTKAVMDHADADKSDNFKDFAARASAEVLLAFVKQHVPPRAKTGDPVLLTGTSPLPANVDRPGVLLNARYEVVPFHGRADVLTELRAWCEGGGLRVRLVHAEGGMGKTRLAIELCKQMCAKGWCAGFVRKDRRLAELLESDAPVLAAIDYAESRQDLRGMLEELVERKPKKALRVLLLARNADVWWRDLAGADGAMADLLRREEPRELTSMTVDRAAIFREAAAAFATVLGKETPGGAAPGLADPRYERVLYVHAAALAAVEGRRVDAGTLMEDTVLHEEHFWWEQLRARDGDRAVERIGVPRMRRAVAALTLRGGASEAETAALAGDERTTLLLRDLYPGRDGKHAGGLEPDLLGEAMVWRVLCGEGAGPWLDRVLDGAGAEAVRTAFTVLGRLSEDRPGAAAWIARALDRNVAGRAWEAFEAAKVVGERTAHALLGMELAKALEREGTIELAMRLQKELPHPQQTVSLREVGRWVLKKRLAHLPEGSAREERARLLNDLSGWQSALGQREAALASTQEAVDLRRKLSAARPEAFLPYLAGSLNNLGMMQSALGQREAAIASTQEAVDLRRKLAAARPEAFLPYLAMSLNNLGMMQSALGQHEAALASAQEAVDIRRQLAASRPEAFLPNLAASLNNLGMMQSALGQREAALASTQEAVDLYGKLSAARPEAFLPYLAMSLHNLGHMQNALGQREAAIASTQEAVDLRRKLAAARPEAFLPDLAMSLSNLGAMQSALGQREAALASAQEAVDTIWPFFLRLPSAFEQDVGKWLRNLVRHLKALGQSPSPELLQRIETFEAKRGG